MVNNNRRWREVAKAIERAQTGATTGLADSSGGPAGEAGRPQEALGEGGTAVTAMAATGAVSTRDGIGSTGLVLVLLGEGWSFVK